MGMVSVRFRPEMIAWIRHFARKDGVTMSRWLRNLVERELKNTRPPATDVSLYPMAVTFTSGGSCKVIFTSTQPGTFTGYGA